MRLIGLAIVMATSCCFAQDAGDFKPATSNVLDAQYPRVDSNSRVQIRFKAPDATKVRVNFWSGPKADMQKEADGYWTFTTPPMAPRASLLHRHCGRGGSERPRKHSRLRTDAPFQPTVLK
jgi:hypothetical protein